MLLSGSLISGGNGSRNISRMYQVLIIIVIMPVISVVIISSGIGSSSPGISFLNMPNEIF